MKNDRFAKYVESRMENVEWKLRLTSYILYNWTKCTAFSTFYVSFILYTNIRELWRRESESLLERRQGKIRIRWHRKTFIKSGEEANNLTYMIQQMTVLKGYNNIVLYIIRISHLESFYKTNAGRREQYVIEMHRHSNVLYTFVRIRKFTCLLLNSSNQRKRKTRNVGLDQFILVLHFLVSLWIIWS